MDNFCTPEGIKEASKNLPADVLKALPQTLGVNPSADNDQAQSSSDPPPSPNPLKKVTLFGCDNINDVNLKKALNHTVKDPVWIIPKYLKLGTFGLIAGPGGTGKGLFSLSWLIALAEGIAPMGVPDWKPDRPFKTAYISLEDDEDSLALRCQNVTQYYCNQVGHALSQAEDNFIPISLVGFGNFSFVKQTMHGYDKSPNFDIIMEQIRTFGSEVVIMDSFSEFYHAEENDNGLMTNLIKPLLDIVQNLKITLLFIHHTNKLNSSTNNKSTFMSIFSQDTVRGASSIVNSARFVSILSPIQTRFVPTDHIKSTSNDNRQFVGYQIVKNNYGKTMEKPIFLERCQDIGVIYIHNSTVSTHKAEDIDSIILDYVMSLDNKVCSNTGNRENLSEITHNIVNNCIYNKTQVNKAINDLLSKESIFKIPLPGVKNNPSKSLTAIKPPDMT
jgi:archaellum biogenesis ATPase FlaH